MKKIIFTLFMLIVTMLAFADSYEIIKMNIPSIKIGEHIYKVGDTFSFQNNIKWTKNTDAIKARNTRTGEIRIFAAAEFKEYGAKSIKELFIKKGMMSSRTVMDLSDLSKELNNTLYLVDTIRIESPFPLNKKKFFYISYVKKGKQIIQKLPYDNDNAFIVRNMFKKATPDTKIPLKIYIKDEDINEDLLISDSMAVRLLPKFK